MIKKIRVLGEDWTVRQEDLADSHDDFNWRAFTSPTKREIVLDPEKSGREDLLHELFHVIETCTNIKIQEHEVQIFARVLYQVIKDNPKFIEEIING